MVVVVVVVVVGICAVIAHFVQEVYLRTWWFIKMKRREGV